MHGKQPSIKALIFLSDVQKNKKKENERRGRNVIKSVVRSKCGRLCTFKVELRAHKRNHRRHRRLQKTSIYEYISTILI